MKLVPKHIMDYLVQVAKDRDYIMKQWKKAIDLNSNMHSTNTELIEQVSNVNDKNKELVECLKSSHGDVIQLCDILKDMIDRMNDIECQLNDLREVLSDSKKENDND